MGEVQISEPRSAVTPNNIDRSDAQFWAMHAQWKSLRDAWDGDEGDKDQVYAAFSKMWLTPIRSINALAAKLVSCNFEEAQLPEPAQTTTQMLKWDLNRMAMLELAPTPGDLADAQKSDDAAILAAWELRKASYSAFDTMPENLRSDSGHDSPDEKIVWEGIERAEEVITDGRAKSPAAIEAKLWCSLHRISGTPELFEDNAIIRGDLEALEARADRLDRHARSIISAIRSIRELGA